jgi:hypothetical protein
MCPSCLAGAATLVAGVTSIGGITAVVMTLLGRTQKPGR